MTDDIYDDDDGQEAAPIDMIATSSAVHCQQVWAMMDTESPGMMP